MGDSRDIKLGMQGEVIGSFTVYWSAWLNWQKVLFRDAEWRLGRSRTVRSTTDMPADARVPEPTRLSVPVCRQVAPGQPQSWCHSDKAGVQVSCGVLDWPQRLLWSLSWRAIPSSCKIIFIKAWIVRWVLKYGNYLLYFNRDESENVIIEVCYSFLLTI